MAARNGGQPAHQHRVPYVADRGDRQLRRHVAPGQLIGRKRRGLAVGLLGRHEATMEQGTEQLGRLVLDRGECGVVEHQFADPHGHALELVQTDTCLLRAEVHHHDAKTHLRHRSLLGSERGGQLVAGEIDPLAQQPGKPAAAHRIQQVTPLPFGVAV